jgi:dsDNA-binding SOS-regulon protein
MWLNKLKIAIIEKNTDNIDKLLENIPQLENEREMEEAMYLLKEANELLHSLKDETLSSMKQIKKNMEFLRSTEKQTASKLDIKS